jgi:hypothetical protein
VGRAHAESIVSEIKKPGVRDISELKSKLGLKKPSTTAAAPASATADPFASAPSEAVSERDTGPSPAVAPVPAAAAAPAPSASASPFGEPAPRPATQPPAARAPTQPPAAAAPMPSASPFASPFGAPGVPAAPPRASALPPGMVPPAPDPMAPPPGGASFMPSAQPRAVAEAPKTIPGTNILSSDAIFGGRRFVADTEHVEQRLEQIKARQKPKANKLAVILAIISGSVAMVGGVVWGGTAFTRTFARTRVLELQALKGDIDKTTTKIAEIDASLSKTTDVKSRIEWSKWLGANFAEDNLIKADKMAGRNIAFMKGSTAAMLMKYARFSREFFLDSIRFAKKNVFAEETLLSLEKGGGPAKSYGTLVTAEEGAPFASSTLLIIIERKKLGEKDISVPEADGEFPNDTFKAGEDACKVMADPEAPWEWFPCSQVIPLADATLIPKEDMAILEDHNLQLSHLKGDLKDLKELGAKLTAAMDEELARTPDL